MGSILDNYRKQVELDKMNENYDLPNISDDSVEIDLSVLPDTYADEYRKKLDELRNDENDMMNQYNRFHEVFTPLKEKELDENKKTKVMDVDIKVKRAFCPNCGKEIISKVPSFYNPYTLEKISRYECECGAKFNMEYSYPRVMFLDKDTGEEINIIMS